MWVIECKKKFYQTRICLLIIQKRLEVQTFSVVNFTSFTAGPSLGILQDGWHNYIFLSRSDPYKYILKVELKLVISGRVDATRCSKLTGGMPPVPPTLTRGLKYVGISYTYFQERARQMWLYRSLQIYTITFLNREQLL